MASLHWRLLLAVSLANFSGLFQFGYLLSIYNQPSSVITDFINSTEHDQLNEESMHRIWSVAMSMLNTGMAIGTLIGFVICQRQGRKPCLLYSSAVGCIGATLQTLSRPSEIYQFIALGRFVSGLSVGMACVVVPLFGTETSPKQVRGTVGCLSSTTFAIGNLVANLVALPMALGNADCWYFMPLCTLVFTLIALVVFSNFPETPNYLMSINQDSSQVEHSILFYHGNLSAYEYNRTVREMEQEWLEGEMVPFTKMIRQRHYQKAILITVAMACANVFHGTAVIYAYMSYIIRWTGVNSENMISAVSLLFPAVDVLFSFPSFFLIEKLGRRPLILAGNWTLSVCLFVISFTLIIRQTTSSHSISYFYVFLVALLLDIASISVGVAKANWFLNTELFPVQTRPLFAMVNSLTQNILNMIISAIFLPLRDAVGAYSFLILFAVPMLAFTILLTIYVPETKQMTVNEILEKLKGDTRQTLSKRSDSATGSLSDGEEDSVFGSPKYGATKYC